MQTEEMKTPTELELKEAFELISGLRFLVHTISFSGESGGVLTGGMSNNMGAFVELIRRARSTTGEIKCKKPTKQHLSRGDAANQ